jgi:hypothetical protein
MKGEICTNAAFLCLDLPYTVDLLAETIFTGNKRQKDWPCEPAYNAPQLVANGVSIFLMLSLFIS